MKKIAIKIGLDVLLLVSFLALRMVFLTGIPLHEVLGFALAALAALHLLLNGRWIKSLPQRIRGSKAHGKSWPNGLVTNTLLAVSFLVVMVTGLCISQFVLPVGAAPIAMVRLHNLAGNLCIFLMILHLVFHADYLQAVCKKMVAPKKAPAVLYGKN